MNNLTSIGIGVLILLVILFRQVQKRSVREDSRPLLLLVLLAVGVVQLGQFISGHPVNATGIAMLAASLVAAAVFGVLRAYTVRLWREGGTLYRQGNWLTVLLWLVAIGVHFGADVLIDHSGSAKGLSSAAITLYIAVSFGVQRLAVGSRTRAMVGVAA
jgi:FtsH-binding integral membrane protein